MRWSSAERPLWAFYEDLVGTETNRSQYWATDELYELMATALALTPEEREFFTASNLAGTHL